jgi:hypothetical protein
LLTTIAVGFASPGVVETITNCVDDKMKNDPVNTPGEVSWIAPPPVDELMFP